MRAHAGRFILFCLNCVKTATSGKRRIGYTEEKNRRNSPVDATQWRNFGVYGF